MKGFVSSLKRLAPFWLTSRIGAWRIRRKLLLAYSGHTVFIKSWESQIGPYVSIPPSCLIRRCVVGGRTYMGERCVVMECDIGKYCSIGPGVQIGLGSHPMQFVSTNPLFYIRDLSTGYDFADRNYHMPFARTRIQNDVWIGTNALIKDGIVIGDGAIIGAGAVVTKDVPAYAVVVGVPARVIRHRFDEATIKTLVEFRWWDRDESWLRINFRRFHELSEFMKLIGSDAGGKTPNHDARIK